MDSFVGTLSKHLMAISHCMRPSWTISPTCPFAGTVATLMYNFAVEVHHPRNNALRPNWRVLLAALMNNFADRTILAFTAVGLMDNLADESTIYATLGCGLNWRRWLYQP
jgi:hypothetical protein